MEPKGYTENMLCALRSSVGLMNTKCVRSVLDSMGTGNLRRRLLEVIVVANTVDVL